MELFLKFADEADARSVLSAVGVDLVAGPGETEAGTYDLDIVFGSGVITRETGETTEFQGVEVPVRAPIPGFHVNMLWHNDSPPAELLEHSRTPANPACVFATDDQVASIPRPMPVYEPVSEIDMAAFFADRPIPVSE